MQYTKIYKNAVHRYNKSYIANHFYPSMRYTSIISIISYVFPIIIKLRIVQ